MFVSLAATVFLMGLMGGAHCLTMCAAPCGALTGGGKPQAGVSPVLWMRQRPLVARTATFHMGRLAGYSAAGALVALAMDRLAWLGQHSTAVKPLWTLTHVLVIAWGLMMVLQARQPAWIEQAGRAAWRRVRPLVARPGGLFITGMAWALLPCGLLYTALLTAALSGSAARGALCMLLFGLGSGAWLVGGPLLWQWLRKRFDGLRDSWGSRLAGLILCALGSTALWMDVVHNQAAPWCVT